MLARCPDSFLGLEAEPALSYEGVSHTQLVCYVTSIKAFPFNVLRYSRKRATFL